MDDEPIDLRPHMLCLNVQRGAVDDASEELSGILWRAGACLTWARKSNMPVVHVHTLRAGGHWSPPIAGFEPQPTEVVIAKRSLAAFDDAEWRRSTAARGRRFFVVGISIACDALETAFAGVAREARLVLVRDALSFEHSDGLSPTDAINRLCRTLAPYVVAADTHEITARYGPRIGF